ncbi:flagellar biosynthesis anti-sigma factor FlgM [Sedimenticola sp.]|uniref:flagellar biosynthesis anti-sigma factor FlgM n=1 Tax=Sedimenticola sp. TaxID=1940285 RepID=UPI003D152FC3
MKIKGLSGHPISTGDTSQSKATEKSQTATTDAASTGKASAGSGDTVSLTISATRLQELEAQIANLPIADAQHVSDVQRSLATGTFAFEPEDAAENLLAQERDFSQIDKKE